MCYQYQSLSYDWTLEFEKSEREWIQMYPAAFSKYWTFKKTETIIHFVP